MQHSTAALVLFWTGAAVPVGVALGALVYVLTHPMPKRPRLRVIEGGRQAAADEPKQAA